MPAANSQYSLSDLSARFELELRGDGDTRIDGVGTLMSAGPTQVSFLANRSYRGKLPETRAGAVILSDEDAKICPVNCLVAEDPYLAYARLAALFDPRPAAQPGIHPSAVIAPSAHVGKNASIGPLVSIGEDCVIGEGCTLGAGTVIESACRLGDGCRLYANVTLGHGVKLGKRVIVHSGAVIGADGFGIAFAGDHWEKVPQLGAVVVGDDCEIGANTCIDRGAIDDTVLEEDVRIDNLCQIGHNVRIGAHTAIAGCTALAGTAKIGRYCLLGGASGVSGHIEIADRTTVTGGSRIFKSIHEPGTTWSAQLHAQPLHAWQRNAVRVRHLDDLARTVRTLEKQLGKIIQDES
jgi:UDP-3-O-[3-hydroxymyristoyl] glucosamine N-acyltransferase